MGLLTKGHYSVVDLDKFQHYKDRNPPWFKVYKEQILDPTGKFGELSDGAKWFAIVSTALATERGNKIPSDPTWLWMKTLSASPGAVIGYLRELKSIGYIKMYDHAGEVASNVASNLATIPLPPETETETETETDLSSDGAARPGLLPGIQKSVPKTTRAEDAIFAFWRYWTEKPQSQFTPERRNAVRGRLAQNYGPIVIARAIIGCCDNPFNRGDNDRGKQYVDLTLICRSGSKLEGYADQGGAEHEVEDEVRRFGASGYHEQATAILGGTHANPQRPNLRAISGGPGSDPTGG